jgi:DNA-binding MarR family transcriptional regulator
MCDKKTDEQGNIIDDRQVGAELRVVNNMMKRYVFGSIRQKYDDHVQGTNGFIIAYLAEHQDVDTYQKNIEKAFSISRSTASKVITSMEQKGLIKRMEVEHDARLKKLVLTPAAFEFLESIQKYIAELEASVIEGLSDQDLAHMLRCFDVIKSNINRLSKDSEEDGGKV